MPTAEIASRIARLVCVYAAGLITRAPNCPARFLNPGDQLAFVVGLAKIDFDAYLLGQGANLFSISASVACHKFPAAACPGDSGWGR